MHIKNSLFLIFVPVISMSLVSFGNGWFTSYSSIEMNNASISNLMIGYISAFYFLGMAVGSYYASYIIAKVGYIRGFTLFASLMGISVLFVGILKFITFWMLFRFICGFALAALFVIIESWCLLSCEKQNRGLIFSIYLVTYYGFQAFSQIMLHNPFKNGLVAYSCMSLLFLFSICIMSFTKIQAPFVVENKLVGTTKSILRKIPLSMFSSFVGGFVLSSIYSLMPIFLVKIGNGSVVSFLMMITIMGGMIFQIPVGKLSDVFDKKKMIFFVNILVLLSCVLIFISCRESYLFLSLMFFIFGGSSFVIYPLAISYASDLISDDEVSNAVGFLTIAYGLGSVFSPIVASLFIFVLGDEGLFVAFMLLSSILCVLVYYAMVLSNRSVN